MQRCTLGWAKSSERFTICMGPPASVGSRQPIRRRSVPTNSSYVSAIVRLRSRSPPGKTCLHGPDCKSAICANAKCAQPSCVDGLKNGSEVDVDCGGTACGKCKNGKACLAGTDCSGGICVNNICVIPQTCMDSVKDGDETDVDCGGACSKCSEGQKCLQDSDCLSGICVGVCKQAPSCSDQAKGGNETDIDCGGPMCSKCSDGKQCNVASDCENSNCSNGICCGAGFANCDGKLVNGCEVALGSDAKNCGTCGNMCSAGAPTCSKGKCVACGTDCWGPAGCLTAKGRCVQFTCRPYDAPENFCAKCKGLKDVSYDQWLNGGYCGDVAAKYHEVAGAAVMCGSDMKFACCASMMACGGNDNAWYFYNAGANTTYFVGPPLNEINNTNCATWNYPAAQNPVLTRLSVCEH